MSNGFTAYEEALEDAAGRLRSATTYLDLDASGPEAVDAGFSSDVLNAAVARIGKARLILAQMAENTAKKVDVAKGSYGEIDNTEAGVMDYLKERVEPDVKTSLDPSYERQRVLEIQRNAEPEYLPHSDVSDGGSPRPSAPPSAPPK